MIAFFVEFSMYMDLPVLFVVLPRFTLSFPYPVIPSLLHHNLCFIWALFQLHWGCAAKVLIKKKNCTEDLARTTKWTRCFLEENTCSRVQLRWQNFVWRTAPPTTNDPARVWLARHHECGIARWKGSPGSSEADCAHALLRGTQRNCWAHWDNRRLRGVSDATTWRHDFVAFMVCVHTSFVFDDTC